jgi:hypothetical protein
MMVFGYAWALTAWGWAIICLLAGFCVALVGAIYWLVRRNGHTDRTGTLPNGPDAEQVQAESLVPVEDRSDEHVTRVITRM